MLTAFGMFMLPIASATTFYDPIWGADSLFPTAVHSLRIDQWTHQIATAPGVNAIADQVEESFISQSTITNEWVLSGDYFLPARMPAQGNVFVIPVAPDNSTIAWVWASAVFVIEDSQYIINVPAVVHLNFTTDGGQTWSNLSATERYVLPSVTPGQMSVYWNITTMRSWTPALVKSAGVWVRANFDSPAYTTIPNRAPLYSEIKVDYVGLTYLWFTAGGTYTGWYPGWTNGTTPHVYPTGPFDMSMSGLVTLIGLIGLIGTPPSMVWVAREGHGNKFAIFFFGLIIMTFFLALFVGIV